MTAVRLAVRVAGAIVEHTLARRPRRQAPPIRQYQLEPQIVRAEVRGEVVPSWCVRCQKHRVEHLGDLCPICKDDDRIERIELRRAAGWI